MGKYRNNKPLPPYQRAAQGKPPAVPQPPKSDPRPRDKPSPNAHLNEVDPRLGLLPGAVGSQGYTKDRAQRVAPATKVVTKSSSVSNASKVNQVAHISNAKFSPAPMSRVKDYERKSNDYYQTLASPSEVVGVRIPDDNGSATATFSILYRLSLSVVTTGVAGVILGRCENACGLIPCDVPETIGILPADVHYCFGFQNMAGATTSTVFSDAASTGSPLLQLPNWNATPAQANVAELFTGIRLVSAGISAISTAASTALSGIYQLAFLPKGYMDTLSLNAINVAQMNAAPNSIIEPLNAGKGVSATYTPADNSCLEFTNPQIVSKTTSPVEWDRADPGAFVLIVSGASPNSVIQVTAIFNYEGIPNYNTLSFFSVGSTQNDPLALATAMNLRDEDRLAEPGLGGMDGMTPTEPGSRVEHPMVSHYPLLRGIESAMTFHTVNLVRATGRRRGRTSSASVKVEPQTSTFERILAMVLPLAGKLLSSVV